MALQNLTVHTCLHYTYARVFFKRVAILLVWHNTGAHRRSSAPVIYLVNRL